jgi:hypothetical protein
MPHQVHCPTSEVLQQFLLGHVDEVKASQVQDHLSWCQPCQDRLTSLQTDDTLLAAMRVQAWEITNDHAAVVNNLAC